MNITWLGCWAMYDFTLSSFIFFELSSTSSSMQVSPFPHGVMFVRTLSFAVWEKTSIFSSGTTTSAFLAEIRFVDVLNVF